MMRLLNCIIAASGMGIALLSAGCVTNQPWLANKDVAAPAVCEAQVLWDARVQITQDVMNGGRPLPGLAGRLYLFGSELGMPVKGDGTVAVDLYDVSKAQPGIEPKRLERWQFDPISLNKLLRKDKIGWGYTLFLPSGTLTPEITRVQLKLCYTPSKGTPLYPEPTTISLHNQLSFNQTRQIVGKEENGTQLPR
jgi:hypothetical protein